MNEPWNIEQLRDFIQASNQEEQNLLDLINSVDESISIFRYHFFTARDALKDFFANQEASPEYVKIIIGVSEKSESYHSAKLANKANTIAAIYTVRSLYDLFAQLVRSLLLKNSLKIEHCNIHQVKDMLVDSDLKNCLNILLSSQGFLYVNAFANTSKHRCLIKSNSLIDFQDNKIGVKFHSFEYRKKEFPSFWSEDILKLILETKNVIVKAGNELNKLYISNNQHGSKP